MSKLTFNKNDFISFIVKWSLIHGADPEKLFFNIVTAKINLVIIFFFGNLVNVDFEGNYFGVYM